MYFKKRTSKNVLKDEFIDPALGEYFESIKFHWVQINGSFLLFDEFDNIDSYEESLQFSICLNCHET